MDILGQLSDPTRIKKLTEYTLGPRGAILFTGSSDGTAGKNFVQIGWNADWNQVGSTWKSARFINNLPATAIRIGETGFEVLTTSTTSGDLESRLGRAFVVRATTGEDRIVVGPNWHFQIVDEVANDLGDYRLMLVPLANPAVIYNNVRLSKSTVVRKATDYGVHTAAKAIHVVVYVTASTADATIKVYKEAALANRTLGTGVVACAQANKEAAVEGVVFLGEGSYASKFVIETTNVFTKAYIAIKGYYT